jgi:hypothetical protein
LILFFGQEPADDQKVTKNACAALRGAARRGQRLSRARAFADGGEQVKLDGGLQRGGKLISPHGSEESFGRRLDISCGLCHSMILL